MTQVPAFLAANPAACLYGIQAAAYLAAAALYVRKRHHDLAGCYMVSAIVHTGLAALHLVSNFG